MVEHLPSIVYMESHKKISLKETFELFFSFVLFLNDTYQEFFLYFIFCPNKLRVQ